MAHLLANNPGQQDAGEILLSGFTQMALQMEAQRRLNMKPGSKPRRGKKGPKKQPQRGLGVAQLEKIRLEEQRRASQQLAALRQLHTAPPLFSSSGTAIMHVPAASIIPQLERESINHHANSLMIHTHPAMSSSLAHFPCIDTIPSSFLLNNASPLSSAPRPSAPSAPLDLFPTEKFAAMSSMKSSDGILADKNWSLQQAPCENRSFLDNPHNTLNLACDQSNEGHDQGNISCALLHMRRNCAPTISELRNSGQIHQVPNRMASTPPLSQDRMVELSSFQSAAALLRGGDQLVTPRRWAWGASTHQPGSLLSELPMWTFPSLASHTKTISREHEILCRRSEEECELTLRPPGTGSSVSNTSSCCGGGGGNGGGRGLHNFLSLSVGATWQDCVADAGSSTPSPVSNKTTSTTSTSTHLDEHTSPLATNMASPTNFFSTKAYLLNESQNSPISTCDVNLDLTL